VISIVGKPAKAFARAARNLQDVLGEYRDATTAHRRLHEVAERSAAAFFAGELAMNELREAKRARKKWQDLWEELLSSHKRFSKWR
jgi:CHAD domain-containing protein